MEKQCFYYHGDSDNGFIVTIKKVDKYQVTVEVNEVDVRMSYIDNVLQDNNYQTGTVFDSETISQFFTAKVLSIEIWNKYYCPTFYIQDEQWYHKESETDPCYMEILYKVMKYAYDKALEVTGLKTY